MVAKSNSKITFFVQIYHKWCKFSLKTNITYVFQTYICISRLSVSDEKYTKKEKFPTSIIIYWSKFSLETEPTRKYIKCCELHNIAPGYCKNNLLITLCEFFIYYEWPIQSFELKTQKMHLFNSQGIT